MEYWSLEQAKLGKAKDAPLAGQVALVTGAAGAIGFGIARQLVAAGAHVVLTRHRPRATRRRVSRSSIRKGAGSPPGIAMDVTDEESVAAGLADTCRLYGGLDLLVLNAGVAHVSAIEAISTRRLSAA